MSVEEEFMGVAMRARAAQLAIDELSNALNEGVYYLSFASEAGFLGGAFVHAHGIITAVERTNDLGINPGGEVACWGPIPPPDSGVMDRLLTKQEIDNARPAEQLGEKS